MPVDHYMVELRDVTSERWTRVNEFCRGVECEVTGLDSGGKYYFRVTAINDHGQSKPLVTSEPIIARRIFGTALVFILLLLLYMALLCRIPHSTVSHCISLCCP